MEESAKVPVTQYVDPAYNGPRRLIRTSNRLIVLDRGPGFAILRSSHAIEIRYNAHLERRESPR